MPSLASSYPLVAFARRRPCDVAWEAVSKQKQTPQWFVCSDLLLLGSHLIWWWNMIVVQLRKLCWPVFFYFLQSTPPTVLALSYPQQPLISWRPVIHAPSPLFYTDSSVIKNNIVSKVKFTFHMDTLFDYMAPFLFNLLLKTISCQRYNSLSIWTHSLIIVLPSLFIMTPLFYTGGSVATEDSVLKGGSAV